MERLTDRTEEGLICLNNNGDCRFIEQLIKAIDKLAEFEDFMGEQGFKSLDELKSNIECLKEETEWGKFNYNELFKSREELYKENQALKNRWEKLKESVEEFQRDVVAVYPMTLLDKMKELELAEKLKRNESGTIKKLQARIKELELADLIRRKEK